MRVRNPFLQAIILIGAAAVIAVVANAAASKRRQLKLPGYYPDPYVVSPREVEKVAPPPAPSPVTATATVVETVASGTTPAETTETKPESPSPKPPTPIPNPQSSIPNPQPSTPLERFAPHPDKPYVEIGGDDVELLYKNGVLFLDARRSAVFEEGHIAGARPFSVWEADIDDKVNALFAERGDPEEQNKPIVIYCSGGDCEDSHMLAQRLWGAQFNNVYVYKDGFPDWQKRGGAVRTGAQP